MQYEVGPERLQTGIFFSPFSFPRHRFESFFSSRVSIGYPQKRGKEKAFITGCIKPKWKKKRAWNGCLRLIGGYTRLRCLGCSGLLHSGPALDNTDCCHYGKWVCGGERASALNRKHASDGPRVRSEDLDGQYDEICMNKRPKKKKNYLCFVYRLKTRRCRRCFCWRMPRINWDTRARLNT